MAKTCKCHQNRKAAVAAGMDWYEAHHKFSKGDHEHRCECGCGCRQDTRGYAFCPHCHFDEKCWKTRDQIGVGFLGMPVYKHDTSWDMPVEDIVVGATTEDVATTGN